MIKLIAADMDGTLIGNNGCISEENIKAVKKAQRKGIKFAIATGRALCDVTDILKQYNLKCDTLIMNGAQYLNEDGEVISSTYIKKEKVKDIIEAMKYDNICIEIYTDNGFFTQNTPEETLTSMIRRVSKFHPEIPEEKHIENAKNNVHYKNMQYIKDIDEFTCNNNIAKFISFADDVEVIHKIEKKLNKIDGLAVAGSFATNVEVNDENAVKGKILLKAAEKYNINREEVAVLGDGMNDYSMFEEFPCSFAMDNAVPEIKSISKYITDSNINDGVAKAIYRILDENL